MRIKLEDLQRAVLNIGFVGENKHSVIEIDCAREFDRYPDAIPTMVVTPPKGEPYPVVISWEDGIVFWEILGGDLARDGDGEIQLTFTQGDVIGKSYEGKTRIHPSTTASSVMPEPWVDWITEFTSLKDAAVLAKQGAETAKAGAETAQSLAETAQTAAETAQGLAETAQGLAETAQAAAETAQGAAEAAQTSAENAQAAAETAEGNAADSATAAAGSATAAAGSASDASGSATAAEVSATAAAGSASDAADSATAAAGSATDAASSASDAADSAADAAASAADAAQAAEEIVEEALAGKADKVESATSGNFAGLDENGNLVDSGHKHSDYLTQHQSIAGKADKVSNATNGNFAGLDANGNLTDSGKKPGDFLTQHQDISGKADKASNATNGNFAALDANGNLKDSGHKHSDYLTQHQDISGKLDKPVTAGTSGQVLTSDGNGGQSWQTPQSGGGTVTDVQMNGTSVLDGSVAKIPAATDSTLGVVKVNAGKGTFISGGDLALNIADESMIKNGTGLFNPIGATRAKDTAFYGLARAAGDTSQSSSSNPIGTYTDGAKAAIKNMLGVSDPEDLIDDTAGVGDTNKTFSADKLATDHSSLLNALNQSTSATNSDIGKAHSPKTVVDGKVTEWQYVEVGGGGQSDIGLSVVNGEICVTYEEASA